MALRDITAEGVRSAIAEHKEIGLEAFRAKYGFTAAKSYLLIHDGEAFDSKAIAGAAHGYIPGQAALRPAELSGGLSEAVKYLRRLGFNVPDAPRNGPWTRDELVLALDLYMTNPASPPGKASAAVGELSNLLDRLGAITGATKTSTYRNPNGVYLKMMNLRALDPAFTSQGKVGMSSNGKLEKEVWTEFYGRRDELREAAQAIRLIVQTPALAKDAQAHSTDESREAQEGGITYRLHKRYERDRGLADDKRKAAAALNGGRLECEVCDFEFVSRYGPHGDGFIEVHHKKPVHTIKLGERTKLADLALLCSNCHRMAHRSRVPLSVEQLRTLLI